MKKNQYNSVVFYDESCGFCSASVQFILEKRKSTFYFCPLQSDLAKELLAPYGIEIQLKTIYYLKDGKVYDRSSAVLRITRGLKGGYPLLYGFYIIPKFIRDAVYDTIAKRRHKIKTSRCLLPSPKEKSFFIGITT